MSEWETIPAAFWKTVTPEEFAEVARTSSLGPALCKRLWSLEGRTDKPPKRVEVAIRKEDLERLFPPRQ